MEKLFSDLVYEVEFAGRPGLVCFVLYEHQSTVDLLQPVRLLAYMSRVWDTWVVHDDWKQSVSYYLDVHVNPAARGRSDLRPMTLLLRASDWKGSLDLQLRMARRGDRSSRDVLEDGDDVLPAELRVAVLSFFLGYVEGFASRAPLPDFERTYAYGEVEGLKYGVKAGTKKIDRLNDLAEIMFVLRGESWSCAGMTIHALSVGEDAISADISLELIREPGSAGETARLRLVDEPIVTEPGPTERIGCTTHSDEAATLWT